MEYKNILVLLVAIFAVSMTIASVSADNFASITSVEVNGVVVDLGSSASNVNVGIIAGQTIPIKVNFGAQGNASDVRLKAWISGASGYSYSSDRFDVYSGSSYSNTVALQVPLNIDPTEGLQLHVSLESQDSGYTEQVINLAAQRESYLLEILDANMDSTVQAGDNVPVDVVLRNRGSHNSDDTFVKVSIPALGVEQRAYFGDMSPVDQPLSSNGQDVLNTQDASERSMVLSIPLSAKPGVYTVQIDAYNGDSSTEVTRKVVIAGPSSDTLVVSPIQSQTFGVGDQGTYSITLVNSGDKIKVYNIAAVSSSDALSVSVDQSLVAIPAGSSQTIKVTASATKADIYTFAVNVQSAGDNVAKESFTANVSGSSTGSAITGNTAVVLTVVLAIVFVVLLVVLIVLLTRKPEKSQEFGESYY